MIKYLKYMFVAAILMVAATGCQEDPEDAFSTAPKAPELVSNGSILMTRNTMSEIVKFAWSKARFTNVNTYTLYAQYEGGSPVSIGSTDQLFLDVEKEKLHTALLSLSGAPQNASFNADFYVVASGEDGDLESNKQSVTIYSYGNAVSAVVTASEKELVFTVEEESQNLNLLEWDPARLEFNEAISYNLFMQYGENDPVLFAKDVKDNKYGTTIEKWNDAVISTGAPEATAADVKIIVSAYSEAYPEGVPSAPVSVNITTYSTTYPAVMYLPGSYQGWDPASSKTIPLSTFAKGYYEAFFNLENADGGDTKFKFSPVPAWENDFGFEEVNVSTDKGFAVVSSNVIGSSDIAVPSGLYRIALNKKMNTLNMLQIKTVGLIGDATVGGWSEETKMTLDPATMTYSVVTNLFNGKGFKFRINDDWDYSIGNDGTFSGGDFKFDKEDGEYKVILDVSKHPYTVKFLSTSFPERLYVPGEYQVWEPANAPTLESDGEGHYEGGIDLTTGNGTSYWKFSPKPAWDGDFAGSIELDENGYGVGTYGGGGNIEVPDGYYYINVDMTEGTFTLRKINEIGIIGGFEDNNWSSDVAKFTYDKGKNVWVARSIQINAGVEFKIRMNNDWACNRGIAGESPAVVATGAKTPVYHDGPNMKVAQDGVYTITLDMSTNPNTVLIEK